MARDLPGDPEQRTEAEERPYHLPAESIRHGWIESSLGLHLLAVGMVYEAIIVAAFAVASVIIFVHVLLNPDLGRDRYCCYPDDVTPGVLGECTDPDAGIYLTPGVLDCPGRSKKWVELLYASLYLAAGNRMFVYLWDLPFEKKVQRTLSNANYYGIIPNYQWALAIYSIGAFFFGTHNHILKRKAIRRFHLFFGVVGIVFTLFFVGVVQPLDDAWGCYGYVSAARTNWGLCTDPTSRISKSFGNNRDTTRHAPVYWWVVCFIGGSFFLSLVMYMVSIRSIETIFYDRAIAYLGDPNADKTGKSARGVKWDRMARREKDKALAHPKGTPNFYPLNPPLFVDIIHAEGEDVEW